MNDTWWKRLFTFLQWASVVIFLPVMVCVWWTGGVPAYGILLAFVPSFLLGLVRGPVGYVVEGRWSW